MVRTRDEDETLVGAPATRGRMLVTLLGFTSATLLTVALLQAGPLGDLSPLMVLLTAAVFFECASALIPGFGYVNLGFFVCLAAVLGSTPPGGLGDAPPDPGRFGLPLVSRALLIGFTAQAIGWVFRMVFLGDSFSGWRRLADVFLNLVRLGLVGLVVLNIPGLLVPPVEPPTSLQVPGLTEVPAVGPAWLQVVSWAGLVALVVAFLLHVLFDRLAVLPVLSTMMEPGERQAWSENSRRVGVVHSAMLVLAGFVSVVVAQGILAQIPTLDAALPLAVGLVASGLPVVVVNRLSTRAEEDDEEDETEILQAALRGARQQLEAARGREEALAREVQKKAGDLEVLFEMARDLGAATSLQDTLDIVMRMVRQMVVPFQSCVVFVLQDGYALPARSSTPYGEVLEMAHLLQLEEPAVRQALKTGRPHLSSTVRASSEQRIFQDEESLMCAPLIVNKEPIGVIYVGARTAGTYSEEELNTLTMLAAHAAPSIHAVRLFESKQKDLEEERRIRTQVEAQKSQLEGLQNMVQSIGQELRQEHSLEVIQKTITELFQGAQSVITLLEVKTDEREVKPEGERVFMPTSVLSPYKDFVKDMAVRPGEGFLGQVLQHRSRIWVNDFQEYSHQNLLANELSAIAAPLMAEDDLLGCLYVGAPNPQAFNEADVNLIQTIASQAALALKNARLMDQTRQQALTDGLTGLYTHRFFKEQLKLQVDDARRSGKPACLILLDTDKFKQYNDTLGHPAGDALLKEIADILRESVRPNDVVCRQGGDEFAIIMRESPKEWGVDVAQRIRETFELRFAERQVRVTGSIGVSCFPSDALGFSDLVQHADEALYRAKNTGRNRVCVAPSLKESRESA